MSHQNQTTSNINLFLNWLELLANNIMAEFNVAYKRYKPIEIIYIGLILSTLIIYLVIFCVNHLYVHYPNSGKISKFFAIHSLLVWTYVACMLRRRFPKTSDMIMLISLTIMSIANASFFVAICILSPMPMITSSLVHFNHLLHFNELHWVLWTKTQPHLLKALTWSYWQLYHCTIVTIIILCLRRARTEMMLLCITNITVEIVGFLLFYFYPSLPIASTWKNIPMHPNDILTIKVFYDMRHHITPHFLCAPVEFPSFHVIWATICAISMRNNKYLLAIFGLYAAFVYAATILLGWHFIADVICGACIAFVSYYIAIILNRKLSKKYPNNCYAE